MKAPQTASCISQLLKIPFILLHLQVQTVSAGVSHSPRGDISAPGSLWGCLQPRHTCGPAGQGSLSPGRGIPALQNTPCLPSISAALSAHGEGTHREDNFLSRENGLSVLEMRFRFHRSIVLPPRESHHTLLCEVTNDCWLHPCPAGKGMPILCPFPSKRWDKCGAIAVCVHTPITGNTPLPPQPTYPGEEWLKYSRHSNTACPKATTTQAGGQAGLLSRPGLSQGVAGREAARRPRRGNAGASRPRRSPQTPGTALGPHRALPQGVISWGSLTAARVARRHLPAPALPLRPRPPLPPLPAPSPPRLTPP